MSEEKDIKELGIEESLQQLEAVLSRMEAGDTGLEESFKLYEQGLKLVRQAEAGIDRVEKQIKILNEEE